MAGLISIMPTMMDETTSGTISIFSACRNSVPTKTSTDSNVMPNRDVDCPADKPTRTAAASAIRICQCRGNANRRRNSERDSLFI